MAAAAAVTLIHRFPANATLGDVGATYYDAAGVEWVHTHCSAIHAAGCGADCVVRGVSVNTQAGTAPRFIKYHTWYFNKYPFIAPHCRTLPDVHLPANLRCQLDPLLYTGRTHYFVQPLADLPLLNLNQFATTHQPAAWGPCPFGLGVPGPLPVPLAGFPPPPGGAPPGGAPAGGAPPGGAPPGGVPPGGAPPGGAPPGGAPPGGAPDGGTATDLSTSAQEELEAKALDETTLPWLIRLAYNEFSCILGAVTSPPADGGNLLFDIFCWVMDVQTHYVTYGPDILGLPPSAADLLKRAYKSDLPMSPLSSELSQAIARSLHLDPQWDDFNFEPNRGVLLVAGTMEEEKEQEEEEQEEHSAANGNTLGSDWAEREVYHDDEFLFLRKALALSPTAQATILDTFYKAVSTRVWPTVEEVLLSASRSIEDEMKITKEAHTLSQMLQEVDGRLAIAAGSLLVQFEFFAEVEEPGKAAKQAAAVTSMLDMNPDLAQLTVAIAGLTMMSQSHKDPLRSAHAFSPSFSLEPLLIEHVPGFGLGPQPYLPECDFTQLCLSIAPADIRPHLGRTLSKNGAGLLHVVRRQILRSTSPFVLWYAKDKSPLSMEQFFTRKRALRRELDPQQAMQWITIVQNTWPSFLDDHEFGNFLSCPNDFILQPERGHFVLLTWDRAFAERGTAALSRAWGTGVVGKWEHLSSRMAGDRRSGGGSQSEAF